MATTYDIGDIVRTWARYTTSTGSTDYKDPSGGVQVWVENPSGSVSTSTAVKSDTGEYYKDVTNTGKGLYEIRFSSTGDIVTSQESWWSVRNRRVTT